MEERVTPGVFYGSAIAALVGLLFGLMLHGGWEGRPGGPRLQLSSAQAAELPSNADSQAPASDDQQAPAAGEQLAALDTAYYASSDNDPGYIPPNPLPVTRLQPDRFGSDQAEVTPAAEEVADEAAETPAELGEGDDRTADAARAPAVSGFSSN